MARLLARLRDFGTQGLPSSALTWSQRVCEQIEAAFNDQQSQIDAIAAAQAAADAAQASADTAQTTATAAKTNDKISASATAPTSLLTSDDLGGGAGASVTVADHERIYGDNTIISGIEGATLTVDDTDAAIVYSTTYGVYYDDPTTSTTTPAYACTTDLKTAQANYAAGRHYCGQVTTPASGGTTTGGGVTPPGGGGPYP